MTTPCFKLRSQGPAAPAAPGFTLVEVMLVIAIVAIIAVISTVIYRDYILRAQTAQTLVNIDHITTVVRIENRTDNPDLEVGATPGKAPPRLGGLLSDPVFAGRQGITLWLIKAPAGTFVSYPDRATYGLVISAPDDAALDALYALRRGLPHAAGDAPWLDARTFAIPLEPLAVAAPAPNPDPTPDPSRPPTCANGTAFGSVGAQATGDSWRASATVVTCSPNKKPLALTNASVVISRTVKVRDYQGNVREENWGTVTEKINGGLFSLAMENLAANPGYTVLSVTFTVLDVKDWDKGGGTSMHWDAKNAQDSKKPSITVTAPANLTQGGK